MDLSPASKAYSNHDVLVIGGGAAGLSLALKIAQFCKVTVLSKSSLQQGSTYYAQGGIAAVLDEKDSDTAHVEDTLKAGAGLCHQDVVQYAVSRGPECINWLMQQGVEFTRLQQPLKTGTNQLETGTGFSGFHLTQEGGHSHRRVIHAADATGKAIFRCLSQKVLENPNITVQVNTVAIDLITSDKLGEKTKRCVGAYVLDESSGHISTYKARFVVLATGGASKAYLYTSNPDGASGDGIAMAWRAGCRTANMEFNQFHPTCLYHPKAKTFLISEALRGEGGILRLPDGTRFMPAYDERAELAPRDIVARAIDAEMKRLGCDCVYLDITHKEPEFIRSHFPSIYKKCLKYGIDICTEQIPVVPAAHYSCGGIMVDKDGQTDLKNLYAIGETSFTGLHGANRMASNSLLECFVFAFSAGESIRSKLEATEFISEIPQWDESQVTDSDEDVVISHNWDEIRRLMWDYVGIVRTNKRLQRAANRVRLLRKEIHEYYSNYRVSTNLLELRNLALVAELIIKSANSRKESRGLHYTLDYPGLLDKADDTILVPDNYSDD
ncbi:MAG: L-aspartate oxidase [Gammaproteobacteria bacterium]|nr:L-aspartate oxidase [Gammaproteobacteria bacterium]|tara:strand:- start:69845 stop:71506 length:1662 start_codon:yes stop_codon:yes gene_type:complete